MSASTNPEVSGELLTLPGPMEPTGIAHFESRDGTRLYGEWFAARQPRAAAVIVHGYAEHCGRYRETAHVLVNSGVSCLSYDMRGHGRADGQRGHTDSYRDYLDDMNAAIEQLDRKTALEQPNAGKLPIIVLAHSNGGLIALRALSDPFRCPRRITAAIISSPFLGLKLKVPIAKDLAGRAMSRVLPTLSLPNDLRIEDLTHDPGKLAERRVDTLCHDVASSGWYGAALGAQKYVAEFAHRVRVPSLWLVAGSDPLCDPATTRSVHGKIRAPSRYHEFPAMFHEVLNEVERGEVFQLISSFLDERLSK